MDSWKAFAASCWLWKHFLYKICQDAQRSDCQLEKGQMNMADKAKLCSSICSTFEALVVLPAVRYCHAEGVDLFCSPMLSEGIAVFSASLQFAEHTSYI